MPTSPVTERPPVLRARWTELDPLVLHDLVRLRVDVFVVEQSCPYPELDGRDTAPGTEHVWTSDDAGPTAYLRTLVDPGGALRIGRICTRADARGAGLAAHLVADVLRRHPGRPMVLEAQAHLASWYGRFGFVAVGDEYLEDGIAHITMRRNP